MSNDWVMDDDQFASAIVYIIQEAIENTTELKSSYIAVSGDVTGDEKHIRDIVIMLASAINFRIKEGTGYDFNMSILEKCPYTYMEMPNTDHRVYLILRTQKLSTELRMCLVRKPE